MKLNKMNESSFKRFPIDTFGGYNHNLKISTGEFYDMTNLSSDRYPMLSPRRKRGRYLTSNNVHGMISKEYLCYVDGQDFVIGTTHYAMELSSNEKQLVNMGAYVIILPDKKYINTQTPTDRGSIEMTHTTTGTVSFAMCNVSGENYQNMTVSASAPSNPSNGALWVDTSSEIHQLKQWSSTSSMWVSIATTYVKISAPNLASDIKDGDGIKITGLQVAQLASLEGQTSIIQKAYHTDAGTDDYIIVIGILDQVATQTSAVTFKREMPTMDYVVESENRLWGCYYGSRDGTMVNEIYACKLGDFKNWNVFAGISTDSYAASCGSDGKFTGAITYGGYPIFFKENYMHKVYGNYPSNYQVQSKQVRGVQLGSYKSLAIVNEVLYYKGIHGICAYDGSLPVEVSKALGDEKYTMATGGGHANKYYVSMVDDHANNHLFVYDTTRQMFHREDATYVKAFCSHGNEMYLMVSDGIKTVCGSGTVESGTMQWSAETGDYGMQTLDRYNRQTPDRTYVERTNIRLELGYGSKVHVYIKYDSRGEWEKLGTITGTYLRNINIPLRPKRCDHFRLKLVGEGDATIYSIVHDIDKGSDLR